MLAVDLLDLGFLGDPESGQDNSRASSPWTAGPKGACRRGRRKRFNVCRMLSRFMHLGGPIERRLRMTFEWLLLQRFFLDHQEESHPKIKTGPCSYYISTIESYWEIDPYDLDLEDDLDMPLRLSPALPTVWRWLNNAERRNVEEPGRVEVFLHTCVFVGSYILHFYDLKDSFRLFAAEHWADYLYLLHKTEKHLLGLRRNTGPRFQKEIRNEI